ncbi:hypothetical protein HN51_060855 [Arachis hypogaea]|uniref:Uncharacterized protein n=1 Tax=Arachis hypogaea TaxID=3818 RepID=A0A444XB61_ARAHY|nr:uncharacterized protein LOC107632188 isoform X1 [Arachis ipaensis]QHO04455.1 uncharacterized protein DS421_13g440460 [Arachis hypogaea]QHO04456.1 uncharacterized protein DS421_13g440460 [Arachis hypogaea]RYQ86931.1 hypothetical protein Ahy_B10g106537 [Arachis hypogaea]
MNERKLDINAPLMSVRRFSAASPSPSLTEAKRKVLEKRCTLAYYLDQVTEPVAVPFNWEHIPGRPKGNHGSQPQPSKDSPSLAPGKSTNVAERKEEEDDDDDDVYSDALETLSCTESASMKCSASGVSFDADKHGSNADDDKQAQEFMMNRFLPAAKAMTVHPPQYASSRKQQSVVAEQPRDVLRLVREERKSIVNKHITDFVLYTAQCQDDDDDDDDDYGYDDSTTTSVSAKGCGLSFCLLNTVPGMKMRDEFNMSCAYEYGKGKPIKKAWDAIHKSKSRCAASSPHKHELSRKWRSQSERFTYSPEMKQLGGSGRLFRRSTTSFQSKPQPLFPRHATATTLPTSVSCSVDTRQRKEDTITMFDTQTILPPSKENQEQDDKAQRLTTDQATNQDSMSLQLVQTSFDKETKINNNNSNKQIVAVDHHHHQFVPAPLLPKSPSDSWLSRALPLVYMKNSGFPHSNRENMVLAKRESLNASSRWETMVKTWNLHGGHAYCSQELTLYKSQQSKS